MWDYKPSPVSLTLACCFVVGVLVGKVVAIWSKGGVILIVMYGKFLGRKEYLLIPWVGAEL